MARSRRSRQALVEDWETSSATEVITTPGVSAVGGGPVTVVFGPALHDSVDADDGIIDGSGLDGESWLNIAGTVGVSFAFDEIELGTLPTHVGLVWTDSGSSTTVTFEAFDAEGQSLGTLSGAHANSSFTGETGEDRFYGVTHEGGISEIMMSQTSGGLEVDRLQYGYVPEPFGGVMLASGASFLAALGAGGGDVAGNAISIRRARDSFNDAARKVSSAYVER